MRKKRMIAVLAMFFGMLPLAMLTSCDDDRGNLMDIHPYENTYVKYKMNVGTALASLYDIEVTYCDMAGKDYTEDFKLRREGNKWEYKDEKKGSETIHFKFIATAKLKENYELEDDEYDLSHTFSISWYDQQDKAMSYSPVDQQVEKLIVSKADVEQYLQEHPVIQIVNVTTRPN
jgi:hypothetical protein